MSSRGTHLTVPGWWFLCQYLFCFIFPNSCSLFSLMQRVGKYGIQPKTQGKKDCYWLMNLFLCPAASSLVLHPAMFEHLSHPNSDLSLTRLSTYYICFYCLIACVFSCVRFFVAWWTVAHQAPLSMEFSRQEYWSELLFPTPGIFLIQGSNWCLLH